MEKQWKSERTESTITTAATTTKSHIKISLLMAHWGHALNNIVEITINDGQETIENHQTQRNSNSS